MRGEVRAKFLELDREETLEIIRKAEYGVLATVSAEGVPSTVALNYALVDDVLYFHCGHEGEKLENIRANPQASFFVVGVAEVIYEQFTEAYSSAVVQGTIEIVADDDEKLAAMKAIVYRFSNHVVPIDAADEYTLRRFGDIEILKLSPQTITGKARLGRKRPGLEY